MEKAESTDGERPAPGDIAETLHTSTPDATSLCCWTSRFPETLVSDELSFAPALTSAWNPAPARNGNLERWVSLHVWRWEQSDQQITIERGFSIQLWEGSMGLSFLFFESRSLGRDGSSLWRDWIRCGCSKLVLSPSIPPNLLHISLPCSRSPWTLCMIDKSTLIPQSYAVHRPPFFLGGWSQK